MSTETKRTLAKHKMDYAALITADPYVFNVDPALGLGDLELVEHPVYGDEFPVIALDHKNKIAFNTGFYDPWLGGDHIYVIEMHEAYKALTEA